MNSIRRFFKGISLGFNSLQLRNKLLVIFVIFLIIGALTALFALKKSAITTATSENSLSQVEIASVSTLSNSGGPLVLTGEVKSQSEANMRTEASGRVTGVYKKIGDYVSAGEVIATIENSREQAALDQAKAALASAQASQAIAAIGQGSASDLLNEARIATVNTLRNAYDGVDDSIRNKIDPMFSNPQSSSPRFNVLSTNDQYTIDINFGRLKIQSILAAQQARKNALSPSNDLLAEIKQTEGELATIKSTIDTVNSALNQAIPTPTVSQAAIDGFKVTASSVRSSWSGIVSSLSGARDNLTAKTAQAEIAAKQGGSGAPMLTTSQAQIAQAQSGVQLARVALEKTIIRSPISGTLNSLSIDQGDYVSPQQPAAVVSNNGALEIVAYVTGDDSREIAAGNSVTIQGGAKGTVTRIAPALDPITKKIEVKIGVTSGLEKLINGQSIGIEIARSKETSATKPDASAPLTIPIVSLKITPDGPVVFTVASSTLKAHPVTVGSLLGDRIVILSGLTPSMEIVKDARGLKDGQQVEVK